MLNWEAIGAVGEVLGAVAVVVTLAYLAAQVRESRNATAADIYQTRAMSRADADLQIALNCPTYHEIHFKFLTSLAANGIDAAVATLSEKERFLVSRFNASLMVRIDNACYQHRQGLLPDPYFADVRRDIREFASLWRALGLKALPELDRIIRSVLAEDAA
jgi:hypothetical protein